MPSLQKMRENLIKLLQREGDIDWTDFLSEAREARNLDTKIRRYKMWEDLATRDPGTAYLQRPYLMADKHPEWVAHNAPVFMLEQNPKWMAENRTDYMLKNNYAYMITEHLDYMLKNKFWYMLCRHFLKVLKYYVRFNKSN